jgi:adenosylcobinamide-GDP ribazoletransferase
VADGPVRPLSDFAAAIGFLTLLPGGSSWPEGRMPRSVGWYAWVGWLLAAVAILPLSLARAYLGTADALHALLYGVLVVGLWSLLTRFLHWDGLADTFDGVWGGSTPERRLEIMRDSRVGAFGVVAMVLMALVQIASLTLLISHGVLWPLLVAPVVARFSASLAVWELPPARRDGLGAAVAGSPGLYERLVAGAALLFLLVCIALGATSRQFVIVAAAGVVAGLVLPRVLSKSVGGMTGDILGATVLLVETIVLLTAAIIL